MYCIREDMVYAFVMVIAVIMMMMFVSAMVVIPDSCIVMVMVGYKAMHQRQQVREEG
jgi:hypothetical protein